MNKIYQHYIIDLSSNNNFVQVPTVQGDGNDIRGFEVELIQNGTQYIVNKNDCIACIMGTKPDTHQIMNQCMIDDNGYIIVDITSQMSAVKGRGDYQIVLMSKSTNSQLKSFPFYILTTPAAFDIDYIISSDEFQLLTHNIMQTTVTIDNVNKAIDDINSLNTLIENTEKDRVTAEEARVKAENDRKKAETTRQSNENVREQNELNRQSSEDIRNDNELIRQNNESTRQTDTSIAISNAEKATDLANKAAEACESVIIGTGVVMQTEKGAVDGVATLDKDKKLVRSQLPATEITLSTEPTSNSQIIGDYWLQEY